MAYFVSRENRDGRVTNLQMNSPQARLIPQGCTRATIFLAVAANFQQIALQFRWKSDLQLPRYRQFWPSLSDKLDRNPIFVFSFKPEIEFPTPCAATRFRTAVGEDHWVVC